MFQIARSNPPTMEKPPGYSHVVTIQGGARIVFFAGQLGVDTKRGAARAAAATSRRRRCRPSRT